MNEVQAANFAVEDVCAFGLGVLGKTGSLQLVGKTAIVIANQADWMKPTVDRVVSSLKETA